MFVALPGPYQESSSHYTSSLDFQGSNTALLEDTHNFWVPHQVNIVDVQVPEGMVGGEIQVAAFLSSPFFPLPYTATVATGKVQASE